MASNSITSFSVTVENDGSENKYVTNNGTKRDALQLSEGQTYVFDWSGGSSHPLRFSDVPDGAHGAGVEYTNGVTVDNAAGTTTYASIRISG